MYANSHKASRLKKKDRMKCVLSKSKVFDNSVCSILTKAEFDKDPESYITFDKTLAIYEGETKVLIIYKGE